MAHLVYLSQARLALMDELINYHQEILDSVQNKEFEEGIAIIAAAVNVVLDDYYTPDDIENIMNLLIERLQQKRAIVIN